MKPHLLFIAAAAIAVTSCTKHASQPPVVKPVQVPTGWKPVDVGPFKFYVPPDVDEVALDRHAIDSLVRTYQGKTIALNFDYGMYSNSLTDPTNPDYRSHEEMVGGREAHFASWARAASDGDKPLNRLGVYFPDTGREQKRLMMLATCEDQMSCRDAEEVFRTVRFAK